MSLSINLLEHDFGELLKYVAEEKVVLTPKQQLIPIRHIKAVMEYFETKEPHQHEIGADIYKKREEREYPRFYFLDLLALCGSFLKATRRENHLRKGPNWKAYFSAAPGERGFMLFYEFRHNFINANWLLRGGDFGEQIDKKSELIWPYILKWSDGTVVDWIPWAKEVLRTCGLCWNSIDRTHAEDLAIWGLEYCFVRPLMEYFGFIEDKKEGGEYPKLRSFRLNSLGCDNFLRLTLKAGRFLNVTPPFSAN